MDKRVQLARARELGLPAPAWGDDAEFPVLLKPLASVRFRLRFGVKAILCRTPAELAAARERTHGFETFAVEWIPGGDGALWSLGAYIAPGGEALATFCFRKRRQDPPLFGNGRVVAAAYQPTVVEQVSRSCTASVPAPDGRAARAALEREGPRTLGDHVQGESRAGGRAAPVSRPAPRPRRPGDRPRARALHGAGGRALRQASPARVTRSSTTASSRARSRREIAASSLPG